jgi:hypothetical protein
VQLLICKNTQIRAINATHGKKVRDAQIGRLYGNRIQFVLIVIFLQVLYLLHRMNQASVFVLALDYQLLQQVQE